MKRILLIAMALVSAATAADSQSLCFSLDGNLIEQTSSITGQMQGVRTLPYADGVKGQALRLDGYSNYVTADLTYTSLTPASMTISLWMAPETYPMMNAGEAEVKPTYAMVAGNLNTASSSGFGVMLSSQGNYRFTCYISGQMREYTVTDDILPLGQWSHVVFTLDNATQQICAYRNGKQVTALMSNGRSTYKTLTVGTASFLIGKSHETLMNGMFHINTFNGLIDEVRIENGVKTAAQVGSDYASVIAPAIDAVPVTSIINEESAPEVAHLRPLFHGMPAKGWTNETHGMVFHNGKYHVFFQKNGNGPYMARLHWGHITSSDLLNWSEEPIAIAPGASANGLEANDGKGCWSGCVFQDADINDGKPTILYTGVSNAKAHIWQACPKDNNLITWEKQGILISSNGNPCTADASDDFRDPYFFTASGQKYIIIGTSNKQGIGTCLLYKYNGTAWHYQGLFFSGNDKSSCGRFWEMPNVTDLGNGKYLFTCTPLDMSTGVRTLYWIGTIGSDGRFTPDQLAPQSFEALGTSKDGYGLLSPTIYNDRGKLITLGIVPDKVATSLNYDWGWAHNYSLPRELSLSLDGKSIVQKPISAINTYRHSLPIGKGRGGAHIEMLGTFSYTATEPQGFRFLKSGDNYAQLSIVNGKLTLDLTKLPRIINDTPFSGIYETQLDVPEGEDVTIDAILDGSILDIFFSSPSIEGKAFSVRLFPTDPNATEAESFSTQEHSAHIWTLDPDLSTGINTIPSAAALHRGGAVRTTEGGFEGSFNLSGQRVDATASGIVIRDNRKFLHR